ncbi:MAG: radical SAM protein, partial [Desulfobaccales bacterium]
MSSRSRIALGVILKNFRRLAKHPWIGGKLATLQSEKWFFNLLYPQAQTGKANRIRQLSLRITDLCNLRCHTCGQWGDQGFLHGRNLRDLKQSEVSPDRYLEVFRDLAEHGHHPFMYLWGGEPMLYEGSLELIEEATKLGFPTAIA